MLSDKSNIVQRAGKGSPLTHIEMDTNLNELRNVIDDISNILSDNDGVLQQGLDARDSASGYAIDALTLKTEVQSLTIEAQQAVLDAESKVDVLRDDLANTTDPLKGAVLSGRGVVSVDGIAALLTESKRTDLRFSVRGYYASSLVGGGVFYWDATRARNTHNGGTIISPTVPWNGTQATLAAFLLGTGETAVSTPGCFVRTKSPYSVDCFGASGGAVDDTACFTACDKAGYPIYLTRPSYTVSLLSSTTVAPFEMSSLVFSKLNVTTRVDIRNKTQLVLRNVDYDFATQPSSETNGIFIQSCAELDISSNRMKNPWKSAISVWDSVGGQIYRNRIFNTGRGLQYAGIVPLGCGVIVYGSSDITVDHNWIKDIWQIPVFVTGNTGHETFDIIVSNNLCRTSNDNGIRVQPDDTAHLMVHDVLVQGNIVMGTFAADCIRFSGVRVSVVGNKVDGAGSTGIDAQYATDSLVAENIIRNCKEGVALTSYEVVTDNVSIVNNQIIDCTGDSAAIVVSNDSATSGSFKSIRIAGNKITKRTGVAGTTRGISVGMNLATGLESITIENNDINGYGQFGITCTQLGMVIIQGNTIGGVLVSSVAHIQVVDCGTIVLAGNKDRGVESIPPTQSIRLAGTQGVTSVVGNIMPNAANGIAMVGTRTALYRSGNHFLGGTPAAYAFTGVGGSLRTLDTAATTAQIVQFLYTLLDDIGNDRYAHR